jgi:Family of unknown function (DUF6510)
MSSDIDYLDGNAAAGELGEIFAMDITVAEGQCAHCGTTRRFAGALLPHANTTLGTYFGSLSRSIG